MISYKELLAFIPCYHLFLQEFRNPSKYCRSTDRVPPKSPKHFRRGASFSSIYSSGFPFDPPEGVSPYCRLLETWSILSSRCPSLSSASSLRPPFPPTACTFSASPQLLHHLPPRVSRLQVAEEQLVSARLLPIHSHWEAVHSCLAVHS